VRGIYQGARPLAGALAAILLTAAGPGAERALAQDAEAPIPSVVVASVVKRDLTPSFQYVGRVEAFERVELRARVEGFLEERQFREGSEVKAGDLLFVLEKEPYQVVVDQRAADLAGARANLENQSSDLARKQALEKKKVVSEAVLDTATASQAGATAAVQQAEAALRRAELDLSYTEIRSPIDGRISRARYSVGNLVGPSSEPLATVTRLDPVYVTIAVSEKDLIEVRRQGIDIENPKVAPSLVLSDGSAYEEPGRFDYLDPEVSESTDTIGVRAVFDNPDRILLPGQFVTVIVRLKEPVAALTVPQAAVQKDQEGYFVLVVDRADTVEMRRVRTGRQVDTSWVVTDGLAEGERVIVQGIQKVRPDMKVSPVAGES
jgi:membrane fusion protein (multidrug efflux system)